LSARVSKADGLRQPGAFSRGRVCYTMACRPGGRRRVVEAVRRWGRGGTWNCSSRASWLGRALSARRYAAQRDFSSRITFTAQSGRRGMARKRMTNGTLSGLATDRPRPASAGKNGGRRRCRRRRVGVPPRRQGRGDGRPALRRCTRGAPRCRDGSVEDRNLSRSGFFANCCAPAPLELLGRGDRAGRERRRNWDRRPAKRTNRPEGFRAFPTLATLLDDAALRRGTIAERSARRRPHLQGAKWLRAAMGNRAGRDSSSPGPLGRTLDDQAFCSRAARNCARSLARVVFEQRLNSRMAQRRPHFAR